MPTPAQIPQEHHCGLKRYSLLSSSGKGLWVQAQHRMQTVRVYLGQNTCQLISIPESQDI